MREKKDILKKLWFDLRKNFILGIAVLFPFFITLYVFLIVLNFFNHFLGKYIDVVFYKIYGIHLPWGIGLFFSLIFIIFVGLLTNYFFGKKFFLYLEKILSRLPLVNKVYLPAKQLSNFLFNEKKKFFVKVAIVEYPYPGCFSLGFVTREALEEINKKTDKDLITLLIPIPPSPFTGPVVFFPKERVKFLDLSVEDAIKIIVSAGLVTPS